MAGYFHAQRLLALCLAWLVVGAALAQDPKASAAQAAARDWLALVDRSDAQASWNAASKKFQEAMTGEGPHDLQDRLQEDFSGRAPRRLRADPLYDELCQQGPKPGNIDPRTGVRRQVAGGRVFHSLILARETMPSRRRKSSVGSMRNTLRRRVIARHIGPR